MKILIVDDEILIGLGLSRQLARLGHSICTLATNSEEALKIAAQELPDFILMDIHLPGSKDGLETAADILARRPVPIAIMTGYDLDAALRARAACIRPVACFSKPVQAQEIGLLLTNLGAYS
jgi:two-component system, response regulator PdtaR